MNDLISREAAIRTLVFAEETGNMKCEKLREVLEILNKVQPAQQWIPVSERLPEEDGSYLVFGKCAPDEDYYCFISDFDTGCEAFGEWEDRYDLATFGYVGSVFYEQDYVLAWMPLPEPYPTQSNDSKALDALEGVDDGT